MKTKKRSLQLFALCTGFVGLAMGVLFSSGKGLGSLFAGIANSDTAQYSITLDSSNKVTTSGDTVQYTKRGGEVTFTYNDVNSSTSGHASLNNGGYIVNKVRITSIETFRVVFSKNVEASALKLKVSYDGETWGDEWDAVSNESYFLSSNPYFIKMTASGGRIDISSAHYTFTCTENPDAAPTHHEVEGGWDVVTDPDTLVGGDKVLIVGSSSSSGPFYALDNGTLSSSNWYYLSATQITVTNDGTKAEKEDNHDVWTVGRNGDKFTFLNGSNYLYGGISSGSYYNLSLTNRSGFSNEWTVDSEYTNNSIDFKANSVILSFYMHYSTPEFKGVSSAPSTNVFLFKYTPGESYDEYATPVDCIGFTATDANVNTYNTNSTFATENGLVVKALYSDGNEVPLSEGNEGYSYEVRDSYNVAIDPTEKFPAEGTYTLVVSYGNYIPLEITLNVGEYVFVTDITAALTKVEYNTADVFSTFVNGRLTATVEYSNGDLNEAVNYVDFEENGIGMKLLNPKGITYDDTKSFGTPGTWTVRVYSLDDEATRYDVEITVAAIPVVEITLSESSYEMYPEDTLQLTTTINPDNATNPAVTWSSTNDAVASVNQEGKVTANAVGGATITATAKDGSNVYGNCTITVNPRPASTDVSDKLTNSNTINSTATSYSSWTTTGASSADYAGQSAGGSGTIQLRSKNSNSGIVTTATGGLAKKVTVEWNEGTNNGNSIDIYGKSSAYSAPTDLFNDSKRGTKIGSIVNGTSTELTISSNYEYIGVRSYSGAVYLDSITFKWESEGGSSVPVEQVYPTAISLSGSNEISIGETTQLSVGYEPSNTNVKNVSYTSSNANVATVSPEGGLVTGIAPGSATITATAQAANSTTVSATFSVTVKAISVTSVSLDQSTATVKEGGTITLIPTISPSNATNKGVAWTSGSNAIATVSNTGVVTGVAEGSTTITVRTDDGNKTATCTVSVTAASAQGEETFSITYTDLPSTYQTGSTVYTASSGINFQAYNCANYSKKMQFKASGGYLQNAESLVLQSITIHDRESNTLTVYGSNTAGSFSNVIDGTNDVYDLSGYSYFRIQRTTSGAAYCSSITVLTGIPTPTDPTGIVLSPTSVELTPNGTKQLSVSYLPANANQNKEVTYTSSNTSVATVSSEGLITVKSDATKGSTATITATLTKFQTISATCTVTVVEQKKDDHTVLMYICGADLESKNQLATGDIQEVLKVSGQPEDVNIVIETGGASSWASTYGISSSKLERWHVEGKSLVKDDSLNYASMGLTSTLQSFIEYGLNNYPAERTGLVFWNHGGGMRGVCYDEKKNDDVLKNSEIRSALNGALSNCGMSGQKLEWVGYDACLMAVQDIAITNSQYFNYMIASEESEAGYGWDYDNWVDDLYAKKTTTAILKAIVDSFISDNGGASSSSGDQTLSYMDLQYADAYKTAWENLAAQLNNVVTTSNKSTFNSAITGKVKHYADSDYDYFCTFDAWDFVDKLESNSSFSSFRVDSSYTTAVKTQLAKLVAYNLAQKGAGVSKGICMYWPNSSQYSDVSTYYTTSETTLTTWRSFCVNKGTHA